MNYYKQQKWILALMGVLAALILLCGFLLTSRAEAAVPSITVADLYQIISETMSMSGEPLDLTFCECVRVDIDLAKAGGAVDGEFFFPILPNTLESVILYDGHNAVPAVWHWTEENNRVYLSFDTWAVNQLSGTEGLYIFFFSAIQ